MNDPPRQLPSSSNAMSSISAMPTPSASPPWTWPSTIIGLIRTPQSSTAMNRRTVTCAGARVDVDDADVGAERVGQVRRVVDDLGVQVALDALGQLDGAVRGHGDLLDRRALLRVALDEPAALLPLEVVGGDLEHRRGDDPRLVADLARDDRGRRAATPASSASRRCRGRTGSGRCRRARPRCRPAGCRAPRRRSGRTSSRGPGPGSAREAEHRLAGRDARAARRRRPCPGRGCPCACAARRRRPR